MFARDTGSGRTVSHRADERFAMCSTFKWALVAAVLAEVDAGRVQLAQRVALSERDLLEYAPTTRAHVGSGAMKTGTCERCAVHDVAVVWPPGRAPLVIAAYLSDGASPLVDLKRAHAAIARHVVEELR